MGYTLATFDLDGTLLDTVADLHQAANAMLADLGAPLCSEAEVRSFVGKGMAVLVARCLSRGVNMPETTDPALLEQGIARFRHHYARENGRSAVLYPGVVEGLEAFRRGGLALGVVTNKPAAFTLPLLAATGLAGYFQCVVSGDTLARRKPDPDPILFGVAALGGEPRSSVHVGDSVNDVLAARAAGCTALCVPYGYHEGEPVDSANCDGLVSTLLDAWEWVVAHQPPALSRRT